MKKFLFATVLLSSMNFASYAQMQGAYDIAVGVRIAYLPGITVKHFLNESAAIEGLVTTTGFRNTAGFLRRSGLTGNKGFLADTLPFE